VVNRGVFKLGSIGGRLAGDLHDIRTNGMLREYHYPVIEQPQRVLSGTNREEMSQTPLIEM